MSTPEQTQRLAEAYTQTYRQMRARTVPPPEQLKAYADQLPAIYRDILAAFQSAAPVRTEGDPVAFGTIRSALLNEGKKYTEQEIELASGRLVDEGFLDEVEFMEAFAPTPLGEALIAIITGKRARAATVPDLPKPTW